MSIEFAVERLYQSGWKPDDNEIDFLGDGRALPSVAAVRRAFARAGLTLALKQNLMFNCVHASWSGDGDRAGTAVGATEREAAVWALAQFREGARFPKVVVEPKLSEPSRRAIRELEGDRAGVATTR